MEFLKWIIIDITNQKQIVQKSSWSLILPILTTIITYLINQSLSCDQFDFIEPNYKL